MATRVEKQTIDDTDVVVGYGLINVTTYTPPVPPATTGTTTYTTEDVVVDVEIDYSSYYERIATAAETIATQITTLATQATTIATQTTIIATQATTTAANTTTIASKQTAMETYQKKMKELGEGPGIHFIGPYEVFGLVSIYRMMIEQAKILVSTGDAPTSEQVAQALIEVRRLSELIKTNISKEF